MSERRGWLKIPGVQSGERSVEEQMLGLGPALEESKGKTVLDLGCAEGLIGREFIRAGAVSVLGLEHLESHIAVAKAQCAGLPMRFESCDLNVVAVPEKPEFDVVLALAVLHKLIEPDRGTRYCARMARSLVVVRLPIGSSGVISGKHSKIKGDVREVMGAEGFLLERTEQGPRKELVQYWRRK